MGKHFSKLNHLFSEHLERVKPTPYSRCAVAERSTGSSSFSTGIRAVKMYAMQLTMPAMVYPTVAASLKELNGKGLLEDDEDERGVRLRFLTKAEWMDLARDYYKARKSFAFVDPTGFTTPEQLASRLQKLEEAGRIKANARIGGVMGAAHHFKQLDITAASRLDLSVGAEPSQVAAMLDAGLKPKKKPDQKSVLVIHVTSPLQIDEANSSNPYANAFECLADLIEMGYTREAAEMASYVETENRKGIQTR